jgi:glycosyltransferase involved in cell wall biosynthesis
MLGTKAPAVSVVLPVYNAEAFVADAIGSVLAQTFTDFELILVDDGGTDRSMEICEAFTDPRIRIVRQTHRGLAGARNTGFLVADGMYVAFLDAEDMWAPNKLALHVAHLETSEDLGASTSGAMLIDADGNELGIYRRPKTGKVTARDVFCGRVVVNGSAPVFRWEMLVESALPEDSLGRHWVFDERLRRSEDVECWTRLAVTSRFRFEALDEKLTYERVGLGRVSGDLMRGIDGWDEACDKIEHIAPEFVALCGDEARALELRSMAIRCVQARDGARGLPLMYQAISHFPALLWREPVRTAATLAACLALRWAGADGLSGHLGLAAG